MTTTNYPRYALWIILGAALWLNYQTWVKDYAAVDAAAGAAAHQAAGNFANEVPQSGASAPGTSAAAAAAAVGAVATAPAAAAGTLAVAQNVAAGPQVHIRTDVLDLDISLTGGTIIQADLLHYPRVKGQTQPVRLENHDNPEVTYLLQVAMTGPAGTDRPNQLATFTSPQSSFTMAAGQGELRVPLHWTDGHGVDVVKEFVFHRGSYTIGVTQTVDNHSTAPWPVAPYAQILRDDPPIHTSLFSANPERFSTRGPAIWDGTKYRKLKISDDDDRHLNIPVKNGWIAALQHQFVTAVVPPPDVDYRFTMNSQGNEYAIAASAPTTVVAPGATQSFPLTVFLGPKLQSQLATAGPNLQRATDFGHLFIIAQPLFSALSWVHTVTGNWGVAILVVTCLLKLIFYPLSEASGKSMAKMRALQPRIKNIQEQYKDDKEKLGRATMELYQREKVNPVSGCLPMLIQIPVFFAFYYVLVESVEMRQAPFALWLQDLSSPDPYYILPVLMAGAMFLQQRMAPSSPDPMQAKVMMFMPLAMSVLFAFLPSGLVLYYVMNTSLGVLQQWNINRRIAAAAARKN
ncbi:MAG TPA: membrane protein insertase YidC [Steroidobacteraceae bacterium]|nr:membrane protein insertase YidC [Steroidobacteraceae bacterium]